MTIHNTRWLLGGLLSLALLSVQAWAGAEQWQSHTDAAVAAYVDGDYAEAGQRFEAAVNEAEAFGADDPRHRPWIPRAGSHYNHKPPHGSVAGELPINRRQFIPEHFS